MKAFVQSAFETNAEIFTAAVARISACATVSKGDVLLFRWDPENSGRNVRVIAGEVYFNACIGADYHISLVAAWELDRNDVDGGAATWNVADVPHKVFLELGDIITAVTYMRMRGGKMVRTLVPRHLRERITG